MSDLETTRRATSRNLVWYWLPPLAWMGIIFYLSAQPKLPAPPEPMFDLVLKKGAHFTVYAVLAFLWWRALSRGKMADRAALGLAFAIAVSYAISDEFHQSFVPDRRPGLSDVLIDAMGAATATGVIGLSKSRNTKGTRSAKVTKNTSGTKLKE